MAAGRLSPICWEVSSPRSVVSAHLLKVIWLWNMWIYIWSLSSLTLISSVPEPHCLDYHSFEVNFWNWDVWVLPTFFKRLFWSFMLGISTWILGSAFCQMIFMHLLRWSCVFELYSINMIREGNGNPLQCSCVENPRDGGAWRAAVCGVAQSRTWLKWLSSSYYLFV